MVRIEFQDGVVNTIETLGRGFPPDQLGTRGPKLSVHVSIVEVTVLLKTAPNWA